MRAETARRGRRFAGVCAAAAALGLGATLPARGHDFWIEPLAFTAPAGSRLGFMLKVGHGAQRMRSAMPAERVTRLEALAGPAGGERRAVVLRPGGGREDGHLPALPAGPVLLVLESDAAAVSRLDAARFEAYARDEGLHEVLAHREAGGLSHEPGLERYSRHAKALVQGGGRAAQGRAVAEKVVGLRLEIVPLGDPTAPARAEPLGFRLLFEGRPLAGAQMRRVSLKVDASAAERPQERPEERRLTDAQGVAWFPSADAGPWMLAAVWSRPLAPPAPVTYETFFATFSFASR